jgi:putative chitinase
MNNMNLATKYRTLLNGYHVNTPLRLAHFFAQLDAESGLKPVSENMNYTASRLREVFPRYFPNIGTSLKYERKPEAIANRVYANRMGNGNEASGDGWKYRGRGFIQITGKDNYRLLSKDTRIDYLNNPDWLLREADSMIAALWYWKAIKANQYADADNLDSISDLINRGRITAKYGDANGFTHRKKCLQKHKLLFKVN